MSKKTDNLLDLTRDHCDCACDVIHAQYNHSLSRFNDSSAMASAAAQQAFTQSMAAHHAHLLKLQHDICQVPPPTS